MQGSQLHGDGDAERDQLLGLGIEHAAGSGGFVEVREACHRSRKLASKPQHQALQFIAPRRIIRGHCPVSYASSLPGSFT